MSTPISGSVAWTTPVTINSGDVVASADLNALNKDVAFIYAKPYSIVYQSTASHAYGTGNELFTTASGTVTYSTVSNTPPAGSITFSNGSWTVPVTGLYRITINLVVGGVSSNPFVGAQLQLSGASGGTVYYNTTQIQQPSTSQTVGLNFTTIANLQAASGGTYPNQINWYFQASTGTPPVLGGTGSSSSPYQTWASVEYVGSATGI